MKQLSVKDVEYIAFRLARETLAYNEPIPDFRTRYPHKLESCLATPFQTFSGKSLYQGLIGKAAILLYLMIKNHPFQNGNKRIAITTLLAFLFFNHKWLRVDVEEFYHFTVWVASSPAKFKKETVQAIEKFIASSLAERG